ncbi:hypothetical protein FS749_015130 [Ceratobasidium sp. UAMH 11750]|nr:hypothetical protein FS749_015130 [Ceratobasidium sp. UAMH 11750]
MDYELNQYWSNLPAGSILTCIMDCRVGGRITRPPVKLRGVGCRGGGTASASTQEEELGVPLTPDHCDPAEAVPWDASDMSSPLTPLANTSKTRLSEDIPVQQRQTDQMQAKIFIWTGCHNRQSHDPHGSGALTRVFTDVFESDFAALSAGSVTYEALFHRISEELAAQHSVRIGPQLFQV